jgi:DNA-binding NarL/FixJ family response regulator
MRLGRRTGCMSIEVRMLGGMPRHIAVALALSRMLTPRERAVFDLLGSGYDNRSIARELEISEGTVKRHVTAILGKLRLESRLQAGLTALLLSVSPGGKGPESRIPGT